MNKPKLRDMDMEAIRLLVRTKIDQIRHAVNDRYPKDNELREQASDYTISALMAEIAVHPGFSWPPRDGKPGGVNTMLVVALLRAMLETAAGDPPVPVPDAAVVTALIAAALDNCGGTSAADASTRFMALSLPILTQMATGCECTRCQTAREKFLRASEVLAAIIAEPRQHETENQGEPN